MKRPAVLTVTVMLLALLFAACPVSPEIPEALPRLTGWVTITGTPALGQRLAADISRLEGKGAPSFQWRIGDTNIMDPDSDRFFYLWEEIEDVTGRLFEVTGQSISVIVTRAGYAGAIISVPTLIVDSPGLPISGTVTIDVENNDPLNPGAVLTAVPSVGSSALSFQWMQGGTNNWHDATPIFGANTDRHTLRTSDIGYRLFVIVTRAGHSGFVYAYTDHVTAPVAPGASPPTATGATVTPGTASVNRGGVQIFEAEVTGDNDPPQSVVWSVDGALPLRPGTTIFRGILTVDPAEPNSTLTVSATSTIGGTPGTATVTVSGPTTTVTGVTVTPATSANITVERGSARQFYAAVAGTNDPPQDVLWEVIGALSTETRIARGLLTVALNEPNGPLTVSARSTFDDTWYDESTITVIDPGITLPDLSGAVTIGGTPTIGQTLTANISALSGTGTPSFAWHRWNANPDIDSSATPTLITGATSAAHILQPEDYSRWITVTVTRAGYSSEVRSNAVGPVADAALPTVTSVVVVPATLAFVIGQGGTRQFTAEVIGTNNPSQDVTWSIYQDSANLHMGTEISSIGYLTVASNEPRTTLTIRATSVLNPAIFGSATVTMVNEGADITLEFAGFNDLGHDLYVTSIPPINILDTTPVTLSVSGAPPGSAISWHLGGIELSSASSLSLSPQNPNLAVGVNRITVEVTTGGRTYGRIIEVVVQVQP